MTTEIWKDIKDFEGLYQVSNLGRVRSVDRVLKQRNAVSSYDHFYKGRVLKAKKSNWGYYRVVLSKEYKNYNKSVHRLVAEAFVENPNEYKVVNHIDGNKENNNVENLEWCTYSHNNLEARRMGLNKGYKGMTWKTRCKLAIEYIKEHEHDHRYSGRSLVYADDLLEILDKKEGK